MTPLCPLTHPFRGKVNYLPGKLGNRKWACSVQRLPFLFSHGTQLTQGRMNFFLLLHAAKLMGRLASICVWERPVIVPELPVTRWGKLSNSEILSTYLNYWVFGLKSTILLCVFYLFHSFFVSFSFLYCLLLDLVMIPSFKNLLFLKLYILFYSFWDYLQN